MLRRALLTVVVLSYLTCVLFLSGLQRNDTDDNTARKLQGRNENIHDANNEKSQREFLLNSSRVANIEQMKIIKAPPRASTVELSNEICNCSILENTEHNNKDENYLRGSSNVTRDRRTVSTEENVEEASTSIENDNNQNNHINYHSRPKYTLENTQNDTNTKVIQYTEEEPNLKKVITFWQKLVTRNRDITTEKAIINTTTMVTTTYKTTQAISITNLTTPKTYKEKIKKRTTILAFNRTANDKNRILGNEYLNNILNKYTSKKEIPSEGSTTYKANVNTSLDDDTDIFDYLLNRDDTEGSETHKFNARMSRYSYEFKFTKIKYPIEKSKTESESKKSIQRDRELSAMFVRDFQDLEQNVLNINKPTTLQYSISNEEDYDKYNTYRKIDRNLSTKPKHEFGINNDKLVSSTLPPETIKQIAENVKKLIIKDLHTNVITSTKGIIAATTTSDMASNKNNIVIEKIMEILRKYKTDNNIDVAHTTEITDATVHSTKKVRHHSKAHSIKGIRKKTNSTPHANYPYIYPRHKMIPARSKLENLKRHQPPIPKRHMPPLIKSNNGKDLKSRPITFQTNLIEIPPLGVPVSDPVLPLSHTIIITTMPPYIQRLQIFSSSQDRLFKNHFPSNKFKTVQKTDIFKHSNINNNEWGSNKRKPTEYIARNNYSDGHTDNEELRINKKNTARYKNGPRFYEKLENYQQSNGDLEASSGEDCCKDEIFTREQRPIKHTKKGNDVSFKKLLKTQQRVTEMLERMLARSKSEQPISVETT